MYTDCTIVRKNLEIIALRNLNNSISYLENIREVRGYVLIHQNFYPYIPLKNLRIIRGATLFEGQYSLYVTYNEDDEDLKKGLVELQLPELQGRL